jgi:hypothetical protein
VAAAVDVCVSVCVRPMAAECMHACGRRNAHHYAAHRGSISEARLPRMYVLLFLSFVLCSFGYFRRAVMCLLRKLLMNNAAHLDMSVGRGPIGEWTAGAGASRYAARSIPDTV